MSENARKILFVDDEASILSALRRLLRKEQYTLFTASGGEEGLELLSDNDIQVVISDHRMPGMSGVEFLQRVKEYYPYTVRVILSGYADVNVMFEAINKGEIYRFLAKPWNDDELKMAIRQCYDHFDLCLQNRILVEQVKDKNKELERLNSILVEKVDRRTHLLLLSQKILETLPVPVLGISLEGIVALGNQAADEYLSSLEIKVYPGSDIEDFLPEEAIGSVQRCLNGAENLNSVNVELFGKKSCFKLKALKQQNSIEGCILIFEVGHDR